MKPLIDQGKTKKQAFDATAKMGPREYGNALAQMCANAVNADKGSSHVLFLDKNHPVNGIKRAVDDIRKLITGRVNIKKLYMIPEVPADKASRVNFLPYPENFICQFFAWGQQRTDHETLDADDPHNMLEVQLMFLRMSRNEVFNDSFLRKHQIDGFLRVPMSVESFELPQELINCFKQLFNGFAGIGNEANAEANTAFLAELAKHREVLMQFPDKTNQVNTILAQLGRAGEISAASVQDPEVEEEKKVPAQQAASNGFRQVNMNNGSNQANNSGKSKSNKPPVFLGINIECDGDFERKLTNLFAGAFKQAGEPQQMIKDFQ